MGFICLQGFELFKFYFFQYSLTSFFGLETFDFSFVEFKLIFLYNNATPRYRFPRTHSLFVFVSALFPDIYSVIPKEKKN